MPGVVHETIRRGMGQSLSAYIETCAVERGWTTGQVEVEHRIRACLLVWQKELQTTRCGRNEERDEKRTHMLVQLRRPDVEEGPSSVVSEAADEQWRAIQASDALLVSSYLERATATPLTVEDLMVKLAHPAREYRLPLVRAHEALAAEEEAALSKFLVTRKLYPRQARGVRSRTAEVPPDVRASVHAVADADGLLCGVVDPHAPWLGRKVLIAHATAVPPRWAAPVCRRASVPPRWAAPAARARHSFLHAGQHATAAHTMGSAAAPSFLHAGRHVRQRPPRSAPAGPAAREGCARRLHEVLHGVWQASCGTHARYTQAHRARARRLGHACDGGFQKPPHYVYYVHVTEAIT